MVRRTATTLAGLVVTGTILTAKTACGDSTDVEASGSARSVSADAALAWARCMRAEGVDVPDAEIGSDGSIEFPRLSDEISRKHERAARKCRPFLLRGDEDDVSEADVAEAQAKLLAYARCMRERGIDMPDPQPPPEETEGPPVDVTDRRFQPADKECRKLLFPKGDVRER